MVDHVILSVRVHRGFRSDNRDGLDRPWMDDGSSTVPSVVPWLGVLAASWFHMGSGGYGISAIPYGMATSVPRQGGFPGAVTAADPEAGPSMS